MIIPKRDMTYIVLSVCLLMLICINIYWIGSSPIEHKVNLIQLQTSEFELGFAQYTVHWCADCGSLLCPLYTIYRVTSYLRQLALSILTCSSNMSFGQSQKFEKFELGQCLLQPPLKRNFLHGPEFVFTITCALDLTFLAPWTLEYKRFL